MHRTLSLLTLPFLLSPLAAQQVLHQGFGAALNAQAGERLAAGGDLDGDQRPDFVVMNPGTSPATFSIIAGATGGVRTLVHPATDLLAVARDMNLDGAADLITRFNGNLRAISGLTLTQLWQTPVIYRVATSIDDRDGDGRNDVAAIPNGLSELRILRGSDGSILNQYVVAGSIGGNAMVTLGDVTGDGIPEVAIGDSASLRVLRLASSPVLFTVNEPVASLAVADIVGDPRNELLVGANSTVKVLSGTNGAVLRTFPDIYEGRFAVLGDVNADGVPDLAVRRQAFLPGTSEGCEIVSGASGAVLAPWPATPQMRCQSLLGLGDTNGDGFGDFAVADTAASVAGYFVNPTGGWQIVSGKILAFRESKPTNCAQGPFLPTIGMTLPKLGQVATIAGQDAPTGSVGLVAFSLKPSIPVNLGVFGCDAWFDLGGGSLLQTTTTTTWQFGLPIPPLPQLAGVGIALQAVYAPSNTAIGLDLSNGLWARVGF